MAIDSAVEEGLGGTIMPTDTGTLYSIIGRRIAEIRKEKNLSQLGLATSLAQKRTQTWVSNVESGRRNINAFDLYEIAAVFEIPVSDLFKSVPQQPASTPKSLLSILSELSAQVLSELSAHHETQPT
jgi:transcriptional regulator with XRE-family HTH domain